MENTAEAKLSPQEKAQRILNTALCVSMHGKFPDNIVKEYEKRYPPLLILDPGAWLDFPLGSHPFYLNVIKHPDREKLSGSLLTYPQKRQFLSTIFISSTPISSDQIPDIFETASNPLNPPAKNTISPPFSEILQGSSQTLRIVNITQIQAANPFHEEAQTRGLQPSVFHLFILPPQNTDIIKQFKNNPRIVRSLMEIALNGQISTFNSESQEVLTSGIALQEPKRIVILPERFKDIFHDTEASETIVIHPL